MTHAVTRTPHDGRTIHIGQTANHVLVASADSGGRVGVVEMELPPGFAGPPPHLHHELEHVWYVLEGTVAVTIGDTALLLEAGTCAYVPKQTPHSFANGGDVPARLLEVDTPRTLEGYLDELAAAMPPGTVVDPAVVGPILARHDTHVTTR